MIDHLSLGVSELARSRRFYDTALGVLGYLLLSADDTAQAIQRCGYLGLAALSRPMRSPACTCLSLPRLRRRSMRFTGRPLTTVVATTADLGCARHIARGITRHSCSTPMATASKRIVN